MKVLAVNVNGDITYCTVAPEMRGKGRCNHIAHQNDGESTQDFIQRINNLRQSTQAEEKENFIPYEGTEVETKPYRMSDEEKESLIKIENRMQLDQNIEGGYISLNEPLWNDMDKNYFAKISGIHSKNISSVLHGESFIVIESDEKRNPIGKVIPKENAEAVYRKEMGIDEEILIDEESIYDFYESKGVTLETGVEGMNRFAEQIYDWQATTDIYVLPYYMRIGATRYGDETESGMEEVISSDITVGYKYLLRQHRNPNNQQLAYEALLNNSAMSEGRARYTKGYRNKSLADQFVGKGGVFRACLSGSSIPYSGRAVITPEVMPYGEIKIPPSMAVDIFKPTLLEQFAYEGKTVEEIDAYFKEFRKPQTEIPQILRDDLEKRICNKRVVMNRQPSLHTSSFQSFLPKISNNATVRIHPLYCEAYGADFDGDTVSIYGINQESIIPTVDKSIGAHNYINTHKPRSLETSAIMPSKDALWGLINILDKRTE